MSSQTPQFYEFANYRLDLTERVLLCDGKHIALTPKAFHLLTILVENHGHIVDKEKLIREIWADSFVEDGNLAVSANQLRKALSDSAADPRFIETIPRRGYRFIGDVSSSAADESDDVRRQPTDETAADRATRPRKLSVILLSILGVAVVIVGGWYTIGIFFRDAQPPLLTRKFTSDRITSSGAVHNAAISPDGKYAAYSEAIGGRESLWMRQLETRESIQILEPTGQIYHSLKFSRDGNSLYFIRGPRGQATAPLYRVTALGGVPSKIVDDILGFVSLAPADGQISFVRCKFETADFCALYVANPDGSNEVRVLTRPAPNHLSHPEYSPDGRSIAVVSGSSHEGSSDRRIFEIDIASGADRELATRSFFDIKGMGWLPDGSGLIVSAKEFLDGKVSLWHVARATGETTRVTDDQNNYFKVSIGNAGDRMVSTQVVNNYRLYFSVGNVDRPLAAARDFAFAPSGKLIYSSEDRNIWEINPDGTGQRQLTTDPATDFSPRVSPDGRYIYFASNRTGENHIWRMDADGMNPVQVTKRQGGLPRHVSSDGKTVIYLDAETDRLWRVSTESEEEAEISPEAFFAPAISPDGELVAYFFRAPSFKIGIRRLSDQKLIRVIEHGDGESLALVAEWSPDSRSLFFVASQDDRSILWQQALDDSDPRSVADLGSEAILRFVPGPDGSAFAFTRGKWLHDAILLTGLK